MSFERNPIDDEEATKSGLSLVSISVRRNWGPPRLFEDPNDLIKAICSYFEWLENNPHVTVQPSSYQGNVQLVEVPRKRVATLRGLCLHIGCGYETWLDWKGARVGPRSRSRPDLQPVIEWAETAIYEDKYNGAAAGVLNAALIMRDLGLAEKNEVSGPEGGPLESVVQYQLPSNGRDG